MSDGGDYYLIMGSEGSQKKRDLRLIKKIIIHCSDSDLPEHDDVEVIRAWHKQRGFSNVGYHYYVKKDGTIQEGRPIGCIGAHCTTQNVVSVGVCLGGKHDFPPAQMIGARKIVENLMMRYHIPRSEVYPHNHFNHNKTCPNFEICRIWEEAVE